MTRVGSSGKRALGALAGVAIVLLGGDGAAAERSQTDTYTGTVGFNPGSTVTLTVTRRGDEPRRGWLKARGLEFECEDQSTQIRDLPRIRVRFASRRRFVGDRVRLQGGVIKIAATVAGRTSSDGRAFGEVYGFRNPRDPEGADRLPECSTGQGGDLWGAVRK